MPGSTRLALRALPQRNLDAKTVFDQTPKCSPQNAWRPITPHYALLASVGIACSTLRPNFPCPWRFYLLTAYPLIYFDRNQFVCFIGSFGVAGWPPGWRLL
eukprot:363087-Chlamydomonas_euryale.AAC.5